MASLKEELEVHGYAEEQVLYLALQAVAVTYDIALDAVDDHRLMSELLEDMAISSK